MKNIPPIIQQVGFDFDWDNEKVWRLNLPVEEIAITVLAWHFELPFWAKPNQPPYTLTPQEVINDPNTFGTEYKRTMNSDLSYPLDIMFWKKRWLLLDGLHRLVKARILKYETVKVRKIPQELISEIRK